MIKNKYFQASTPKRVTYAEFAMQKLSERGDSAPERRLQQLGAQLAIVIDRMEEAEYDFAKVHAAEEELTSFVIEATDGWEAEQMIRFDAISEEAEAWLSDIRKLAGDNARCAELVHLNEPSDYGERFALAEQSLLRLMRLNELLDDPSLDREEWRGAVLRLADAWQSVIDHLDWLVMRQMYRAVQDGLYREVAAICLSIELFRSVTDLLRGVVSDRMPLEQSWHAAELLSRTYSAETLCGYADSFDFRMFDDEDAPLMPEIVDLFDWDSR